MNTDSTGSSYYSTLRRLYILLYSVPYTCTAAAVPVHQCRGNPQSPHFLVPELSNRNFIFNSSPSRRLVTYSTVFIMVSFIVGLLMNSEYIL
eukprot:COSAG02_NODE_2636_length_8361_cov_6.129993_1_plen_92_part_00